MTPAQLNEIEARADPALYALADDVLALVARVRELESHYPNGWEGTVKNVVERAQKAEARVRELEHFVTATDLGDIRSRCHKAEARVAVLREAIIDETMTLDHEFCGRGRVHLTSCRLCKLEKVLATLDQAATALADFAREVDEWIGPVLDGLPAAVADKLIAWRKVKGEAP